MRKFCVNLRRYFLTVFGLLSNRKMNDFNMFCDILTTLQSYLHMEKYDNVDKLSVERSDKRHVCLQLTHHCPEDENNKILHRMHFDCYTFRPDGIMIEELLIGIMENYFPDSTLSDGPNWEIMRELIDCYFPSKEQIFKNNIN